MERANYELYVKGEYDNKWIFISHFLDKEEAIQLANKYKLANYKIKIRTYAYHNKNRVYY